jgi:hypothetical protein
MTVVLHAEHWRNFPRSAQSIRNGAQMAQSLKRRSGSAIIKQTPPHWLILLVDPTTQCEDDLIVRKLPAKRPKIFRAQRQ